MVTLNKQNIVQQAKKRINFNKTIGQFLSNLFFND